MEDLEEDIQSWFQCRSHDDTGTEYDGGSHDIPQYFNESTLRSEQRSLWMRQPSTLLWMLLVKSHCKGLASCKKHKSGSKIIIDLALKGYLAEPPHGEPVQGIDSTIQEIAMSQLKLFIFGGHDTIATTICYSYSSLSRNPSILRKLREEHDNVRETDIERAPDLVASQPHLLNQLPYTLETIREILRLFPVVTSPRVGR